MAPAHAHSRTFMLNVLSSLPPGLRRGVKLGSGLASMHRLPRLRGDTWDVAHAYGMTPRVGVL
jgi:hypothetical protein